MFNKKLEELLTENKINAPKLALDLNINSKTLIYEWLSGEKVPKLDKAIMLSQYFKCSLDYLFSESIENEYNPFFKQSNNFGERLKFILKQKKIKQKELINNIKISKSDINYWSKNTVNPRMDTIVKIADYLQVSIDYLVGIE